MRVGERIRECVVTCEQIEREGGREGGREREVLACLRARSSLCCVNVCCDVCVRARASAHAGPCQPEKNMRRLKDSQIDTRRRRPSEKIVP